jgi:DNA invertase Pin-like site-specific DNA recombinase
MPIRQLAWYAVERASRLVTAYVAYYRVSTQRQGRSGLGLDAQRSDVARFVEGRGELLAEYTEIESGRRHTNRPELAAALAECRRRHATLLIAHLDRLARNVAFISALMEGGQEFVAVDMPEANRLMLHILAAVAEHERELASRRTRDALTQAKARGVKIGNPNPREAARLATLARWPNETAPEVVELIHRRYGQFWTLRAIAADLNRQNIRTAHGAAWHASTVQRVLPTLAPS